MTDVDESDDGGYEEGALARRLKLAAEDESRAPKAEPWRPELSLEARAFLDDAQRQYREFGDRLRGEIPSEPPKRPGVQRTLDAFDAAQRQLRILEAELQAKEFWRDLLRFPPTPEIAYEVRQTFENVKASVWRQAERVDAQRLAVEEAKRRVDEFEAPKRRGREIALRNAQAGLRKALAALDEEEMRHASVVERLSLLSVTLRTEIAKQEEADRHARNMARIQAKAESCIEAVEVARELIASNA